MAGRRQNGNITKGNKVKKANKDKKTYVEINEKNGESYGRVSKNVGSHIVVDILGEDTAVKCRIPGKFRSRNWFNPGDYVVVCGEIRDNIREIKGKVIKRDLNVVKKMFAESKGESKLFTVGDVDDNEQDNDNLFFGIKNDEEEPELDDIGYIVKKNDGYANDIDELFAMYEDNSNNSNDEFIDDI